LHRRIGGERNENAGKSIVGGSDDSNTSAGVQNAFADASVKVVSFSTDRDIRRENEHIFSAVCAERNK